MYLGADVHTNNALGYFAVDRLSLLLELLDFAETHRELALGADYELIRLVAVPIPLLLESLENFLALIGRGVLFVGWHFRLGSVVGAELYEYKKLITL